MKILDLYCGAGGAAMGYHRAFPDAEIVGIDIEPQPDYPFTFHQDDISKMSIVLGWDLIHASPPCQAYSPMTRDNDAHPNLIPHTRWLLERSRTKYVIENVRTEHLNGTLLLCGSMFGLQVQRHRYFEHNLGLIMAPACNHKAWQNGRPYTVTGTGGAADHPHSLKPGPLKQWQELMQMPWATTKRGISQAIPPAYTEYIGSHL